MGICSKCGVELKDDDLFCPKCGTENIAAADEQAKEAIPEMTKEESIALAEKLAADYKNLERINREIEDTKSQLARPIDTTLKQHAAFKFFWPYLIYAAVSFSILYFLGSILAYGAPGLAIVFLLLSIVSIPVFLIVGGVRAVRLREEYNQSEVNLLNSKRKHADTLKKNAETLRLKKKTTEDKVKQYDSIIPKNFRDSAHMGKVKILLQSDKAANFKEAVEMLDR